MIRLFDIFISFLGLLVSLPILFVLVCIGFFDTGSPIFQQERVGRNQKPFTLIKFRTMRVETASVATHLAEKSSVTKFGSILRKTKLDELPQLWNVLKGEMSLVGPRPGLYNQNDLTEARIAQGVYCVRPGITGIAQINKIDMSTPELLAKIDAEMIKNLDIMMYFTCILKTILGSGSGDRIK